jgi:HD-GYP domain-containing protein (c-di-GMP phosphodiesterase class II)
MMEQTGSVNQMTKDEVLEMMFHEEHNEYMEQYFNDLRDAMNEYYYEMEVEHGTTI